MAGEKAAVKAVNIAAQNLKGIGNLAGKVGNIINKNKGQDQGQQDQGQPEVQSSQEEFMHIMDNPLMMSCFSAMKVQSQVSKVFQ